MKRSRFTEEQILFALKQAAAGQPVSDVCRQMGISEATFLCLEEAPRQPGASRGL
jgi:putative transposase